ncbi:hypothetical protein [Streptomyces chryseus]
MECRTVTVGGAEPSGLGEHRLTRSKRGVEATPAPAPRSDVPGGDVPGRSPQGVERNHAEGP